MLVATTAVLRDIQTEAKTLLGNKRFNRTNSGKAKWALLILGMKP